MGKRKWITLDELHVEVLVPRACPRSDVRAVSRKLSAKRTAVLRAAFRLALGAAGVPLDNVRVRLSR